MKKNSRQRLHKILFSSAFLIAIIGLTLLAAGISSVELRPGTTYSGEQTTNPNAQASGPIEPEFEEIFIPVWVIILLLIVPLVLGTLIFIFVPGARKYMLRTISLMIIWVIAIYMISNQQVEESAIYEENATPYPIVAQPFPLEMPETDQAPIPVIDTSTPNWLSFIIAFSFFFMILVIAYAYYRKKYMTQGEDDEMDELASEAASALKDIHDGLDLRNVILHCYAEMCDILSKEKGIVRKQWMTPREFEKRLVKIGFPEVPVRTLTELFEFVRYGAQEPAKLQETQAIQSLTAIIRASRKGE